MKSNPLEVKLVRADKIEVGDQVDLENDMYACLQHDRFVLESFKFEYQEVERVIETHEHSGETVLLGFDFGEIGFPPDWMLRVKET